ncbi:hypothetical protein SAMN05216222_2236 [Pseudomonas prosekii]|uniref:Uncharacterized protein n=1 Tax=Pseudomonas prosekii TaxID=1148509 RepID=A0A1H1UYD9_9PSED|nr:hypothetical protein SAMN05216222_2236 [Pseudomonas prosekii]
MEISSLSPLPRGVRGPTELFFDLHRPGISRRIHNVKAMAIGSLSPLPRGVRGLIELLF